MIHCTTPRHHWNYFLAIEHDLQKAARYIEFCQDNFHTYSIELAHILLSASAEVDVVMKQLCELVAPGGNHQNINDYRQVITAHVANIVTEAVRIPRFGLQHKPWEDWEGPANPNWWTSYNRVKHQRNNYYAEANLQNTLNAVGGLLIITVYYYKYAFSMEAGHDMSIIETTQQLPSALESFMVMNADYYYQYLVT